MMAPSSRTTSDRARLILAGIRILNGALALVAPGLFVGRIDRSGEPSPAAIYAFRLFGVRTVLLGRDLLRDEGPARSRAVSEAPLIHACDTATAALLTLARRVRLRSGVPLIAVSGVNTVLACLAARRSGD